MDGAVTISCPLLEIDPYFTFFDVFEWTVTITNLPFLPHFHIRSQELPIFAFSNTPYPWLPSLHRDKTSWQMFRAYSSQWMTAYLLPFDSYSTFIIPFAISTSLNCFATYITWTRLRVRKHPIQEPTKIHYLEPTIVAKLKSRWLGFRKASQVMALSIDLVTAVLNVSQVMALSIDPAWIWDLIIQDLFKYFIS